MGLTLNKGSALKVIRMLRRGELGRGVAKRCRLEAPIPPKTYWTQGAIRSLLDSFPEGAFPEGEPIDIALPAESRRMRTKGISKTCYWVDLPRGACLDLGQGVCIVSPELLFLEMANELPEAELLLLGMELCGAYALPAREGATCFNLAPITSAERIKAFVSECSSVHGSSAAQNVADMLMDNAWSPMEAVLAAMLVLPTTSYGYGLGPILLNERIKNRMSSSHAGSRIPDILFPGTMIGLNYEGEGHHGMAAVISAAREAERYPGDSSVQNELERLAEASRRRYVEDRVRDRDLLIMGLKVLPVIKEDLYEPGALDALVSQIIALLEAHGGRDLSSEKKMLDSRAIQSRRQKLIRSLLPGPQAEDARAYLKKAEEDAISHGYIVEELIVL